MTLVGLRPAVIAFAAVAVGLLPFQGAVVPTAAAASSSRVVTVPVVPAAVDGRYPAGVFHGIDLWVDPVHGSDGNSGISRGSALRTVAAAWRLIPANTTLTRGVRVNLVRGTYGESVLLPYWEHRWGTAAAPIILRSVDGVHAARFTGDMNVFDVRYLYLLGFDIIRAGDAFHCERCSHVLLRAMELSGEGGAHETVKVNQSDHFYIEDSTVHGADDNNVDFVAVTYGHLVGNRLYNAQDWCAYTKGGSAWITVADNIIDHCGTGGFTAGQGTGFEFMQSPFLHYEAYGIRVIGNLIHDTDGAGLGVNGGYNVLLAFNTLYRVGIRSHAVEIVPGSRGCDAFSAGASTVPCAARRALGGWGTTDAGGQWIPDRHVYFLDNVVANPPGYASAWSHFDVHPPVNAPVASGVPRPSRTDDDLVIAGNVLLNGPGNLDLGFAAGSCTAVNPGCSPTFVRSHNRIGPSTRVFVDAAHGDYRFIAGSLPTSAPIVSLLPFRWTDAPARPRFAVGSWSGLVMPARAHPGTWRTRG